MKFFIVMYSKRLGRLQVSLDSERSPGRSF